MSFDTVFEVGSVILTLCILFVSITGLGQAGGKVRSAWIFLVLTASFLGLHEAISVIVREFALPIDLWQEVSEFLTLFMLLIGIQKLRQLY